MPVLQVTKQVQRSQEARLGRTAQRWHSGDLIPDSLDPGSVHGDSALCFLSAPTFLPGNGQWEQQGRVADSFVVPGLRGLWAGEGLAVPSLVTIEQGLCLLTDAFLRLTLGPSTSSRCWPH